MSSAPYIYRLKLRVVLNVTCLVSKKQKIICRPQEIQQCAFPEWFVIHRGDRVHPKSPMPPLSLSSPSSEPKFIPSFVAFEPQCLPLSFPSWLLSCDSSLQCFSSLRWFPHCILPEPWFAVSVHSVRDRRTKSTTFVWCVWARICVELGCDWHCLNHMPWLGSV